MMRDLRLGSVACEADVTHVSLTCGPDSTLNTATKSKKHTDDDNLDDMVRLVENILLHKKTKLLIVEDVVGTIAGTVTSLALRHAHDTCACRISQVFFA